MKIVVLVLTVFICTTCGHTEKKTAVQEPSKKEPTQTMAQESTLKCPQCGHQQTETLPTEYCLIQYTCKNCQQTFHPKDGDCCVFCSYGDHKCPSKQ